ncbi:MAG: hypothetical protein VB025_04620 [Sphaerochaeta sp.]|uniref:hypothetical protein n=1 Tax=Sphaerochaeta associata TaxID=1129264 RepID=UPI002B1EC39D|nr:hypothetical protein [Sphaerochaeta associata]MEA5030505.1 hypothetical protein [Sphaerochaeta associata]MEA5031411.1 hypothetical protein [Sphaerochaeta sp.]
MGQLYQIFSNESLVNGFYKLGLQLEAVFPDIHLLEQLMQSRKWVLSEGNRYFVINSIPTHCFSIGSYWEEWYILDDNPPVHHVLFPSESPGSQSTYTPPKNYDGVHPNEIFGRTWYVRELSTMVSWDCLSDKKVIPSDINLHK